MFILIFIIVMLVLTVLMCRQESKRRKISFTTALLICLIISPLFGYLFISSRPLRNPRGCVWCGNEENEADYCGICGKNEAGLERTANA